jgi:hypothetical protein
MWLLVWPSKVSLNDDLQIWEGYLLLTKNLQIYSTYIRNFTMLAANNLDKIIFLLAIFSKLKASNYNGIRSNTLDRINWYIFSRKT